MTSSFILAFGHRGRYRSAMGTIVRVIVLALFFAAFATGCDNTPQTTGVLATVVLENKYTASGANPLIVYRAFWQAVSFPDAVLPGASSKPQSTVPASANTAYVVLAPGWDPNGSTTPTSFIVMQSRNGFEVHLNDTLYIHVDDTTFAGNCGAGTFLSQTEADFITQRIFPSDFATFVYDAATCTTMPIADAGAE